MNRELPKIDLAGNQFVVTVALNGLQNEQPPYNIIKFNHMTEGSCLVF